MKRNGMIMALLLSLCMLQANAAAVLREFERDSLAQIVASQQRQPFLLIVWSLDCEFCQRSLEAVAQQKKRHPGFRVITLSTDSIDDEPTAALIAARLKALGLTTSAWAFGSQPPEQLRYALDKNWHGEMPRSYWFDANGKATPRSGVLTSKDLELIAGNK